MTHFDDFLAEQMENEEFRKAYEGLEPEFSAKQTKIDARIEENDIDNPENIMREEYDIKSLNPRKKPYSKKSKPKN